MFFQSRIFFKLLFYYFKIIENSFVIHNERLVKCLSAKLCQLRVHVAIVNRIRWF
jgi:hypothetical protein